MSRDLSQIKPADVLCIYHGNCADGFGAACVVRKFFGAAAQFHAGHYGQPSPDVQGKHVFIVDFSYPRHLLQLLAIQAASVTVLDHYKTAEADLRDLPPTPNLQVVFDMDRSGARIAWDHFFPGERPPLLIQHIEDRDLWRFKLDGTREVQAGLFSYPYNFDLWMAMLFAQDEGAIVRNLHSDGIAIERKHQKDVAELVAVCQRRMVIGGYDVPAASLPYTLSSDAGLLMAQGEPFAACYWDTADARVFSLRSSADGLDVSAVAQGYGGGGHRNAAGFRVPYGHELAPAEASVVVPDGWQLVPVKSTDAMHQAYTDEKYAERPAGKHVLIPELWAAMLAAAPTKGPHT